jgi:hypothetical protein
MFVMRLINTLRCVRSKQGDDGTPTELMMLDALLGFTILDHYLYIYPVLVWENRRQLQI